MQSLGLPRNPRLLLCLGEGEQEDRQDLGCGGALWDFSMLEDSLNTSAYVCGSRA